MGVAGRYGTNFMESEVILAAQADDWNEVDRVMSQMTETELLKFKDAALDAAHRALQWVQAGGAQL